MKKRFLPLALASLISISVLRTASPPGGWEMAKRKMDQIEKETLPPRSQVFFSAQELNEFAREQARVEVGDAVVNPKLELGTGRATGSASIDFVKLQTSRGQPPNPLLRMMLSGQKNVTVTAKINASGGKCQVDIQSVDVAGIPLSGRTLELLIDYYFTPRYPEAVVGRPFELRHKMESVEVSPEGATVRLKP